jgi:hypothetical protein
MSARRLDGLRFHRCKERFGAAALLRRKPKLRGQLKNVRWARITVAFRGLGEAYSVPRQVGVHFFGRERLDVAGLLADVGRRRRWAGTASATTSRVG